MKAPRPDDVRSAAIEQPGCVVTIGAPPNARAVAAEPAKQVPPHARPHFWMRFARGRQNACGVRRAEPAGEWHGLGGPPPWPCVGEFLRNSNSRLGETRPRDSACPRGRVTATQSRPCKKSLDTGAIDRLPY
jgi:hypothetical protein